MPESHPPSKSLTLPSDRENRPRRGYIRSNATHQLCEWSFEVLSEQPKVGIATILTGDGPLKVAMNRKDAVSILQKLQLFLAEWPEDQATS